MKLTADRPACEVPGCEHVAHFIVWLAGEDAHLCVRHGESAVRYGGRNLRRVERAA